MITKTHILILGATGYIGSSLYKELLNQNTGNFHFHILIRNKQSNLKSTLNTTVYIGDLKSFNWKGLDHFPDIVYHLARINSTKGKILGRKYASYTGKKANQKLINYLKSEKVKVQLFYLSGSLMYGNSKQEINEKNSLNPISFAKQYITAEKPFLNHNNVTSNLNVCMVRVPWVLGNGSWFKAFYLNYISKTNTIPLYGRGANIMSFITLKDLSKCLVGLQNVDFKDSINLTYNESITQMQFSELIKKSVSLNINTIQLKNNFEKVIIDAFECNIDFKTIYKEFDSILKNKTVKDKITNELDFIFKDK